jgi:hypothetical protein
MDPRARLLHNASKEVFMDSRTTFLRRTFSTNAVVTFLFGALLLVDRELIAGLLGLTSWVPVALAGVICVAFAPVLFLAARKRELSTREAALLVAVDGAWVAASLLVAVFAPITGVGRALVVAQAALVAVFMVLEMTGIRRLQPFPA